MYRKVPKFSDTRNFCCNLPKIQTKRPNLRVFCQNDANGITNSKDPDETAPLSSLIWVCIVCPDLSVRKLRVITVSTFVVICFDFFNKLFLLCCCNMWRAYLSLVLRKPVFGVSNQVRYKPDCTATEDG